MGYNTRQLKAEPLEGSKKNPYKKDVIYGPNGQWDYPGSITKIPGDQITMAGVNYPVVGIGNNGNKQMMLPGMEYHFPGADNVTEYPQLKKGGGLKKFSRVHDWRSSGEQNRLQFAEGGENWLDQYQEGGMKITPVDALRTWDLGHYEGQKETTQMKKLIDDHIKNPNMQVPGGETYNQFVNRVIPAFAHAAENLPDKALVVTHSQVLKAIDAWDNQGRPHPNEMDQTEAINSKVKSADVHKFRLGDKTIYIARHGDTPQNKGVPGPDLVRTKDAELAPKGIKEAERNGKQLADIGVSTIVSSPLPRAMTTAHIIAGEIQKKLGGSIDSQMDEFSHGGQNRRLVRGSTNKNIKSSTNKLLLRNQDLFGFSGKNTYVPYLDKKQEGGTGWLDNY